METSPQPIMIRAIQRRAPTRSRIRLLGISKSAVAEEEQAGPEPELRVGQAEIALQGLFGEADVHAVDVGDDVAEERKRDQPPRDARHDELVTGRGLIGHRVSPSAGTILYRRGAG